MSLRVASPPSSERAPLSRLGLTPEPAAAVLSVALRPPKASWTAAWAIRATAGVLTRSHDWTSSGGRAPLGLRVRAEPQPLWTHTQLL